MNLDLGEHETMLKALAERFVGDFYDLDSRRRYLGEENGFCTQTWAKLGELGLIAAPFDEASGGMGLDATAVATIFEALGRGLAVEPLIENVLLAARLFAAVAPSGLAAEWLPDLLSGKRRIALAHAETQGRSGLTWVETRAVGTTLTGSKAYVPGGGGVDGFIVSARSAGTAAEHDGVSLYFVAANAPGLTITSWRLADGSVAVSLELAGVTAVSLTGGIAEISTAEELASLARSAEALGIMGRIFAETAEHLRTREQFGQNLASFQALQHRMVAQYAVIEQARALLNLALVNQGKPEFGQAVQGVRAYISPASVILGHEMIQFHGGMGVSDELSVGHGHKRLLVLSRWPDSPEIALDRFAGIVA